MHNIKFIREHSEAFDKAMKKRGLGPVADEILQRDSDVRTSKTKLQELQQQANALAKKIGELKSQGKNADEFLVQSREVKEQLAALKKIQDESEHDVSVELADELLYTLPNILADDVPEGEGEADNVVIRRWGEKPDFSFPPRQHFELGEALGLMDFEQAAKISGSRFVLLKGFLARLETALANFMLDIHTREFGYTQYSVPLLVRGNAMLGSAQLPKFAEDAFCTTNDYWLIPTSEVSLVNTVADSILEYTDLPLRLTACTPCFRSEAGSAGKDTRGMIRQHQFWKVELVSITEPQESAKEHERMTACAEEVLKRLGLPYQVVLKCSQDTGFHATKTYDLEVWLPGQNTYREISSCSACGDFQARRMKTRYRNGNKETQFVHTLNGSGVAVGRALIAVMENFQTEEGGIIIPHALRPYMNGLEKIEAGQS